MFFLFEGAKDVHEKVVGTFNVGGLYNRYVCFSISYRWALTEFSSMPIVRVIQVRYSIQELEEAKALVLEQSGINEAGGWFVEQENRMMIMADSEAESNQLSETIENLGLSELLDVGYIVEFIDQTSSVL